MILAEISIDISNPSARQAIRDRNDMHRNIMKAFPKADGEARKTMGVQYRLIEKNNGLTALVMSAVAGNWEETAGSGYFLLRERQMDDVLASLTKGRILGMDVLCVPSKKITGDWKNSRRRFLCSESERESWFRSKGKASGFEVLSYRENGVFRISAYKKNMPIRFSYTNVLTNVRIADEEKFRMAYAEGIGPEKAYGMGMMLLSGRPV